MVIIKYNHKIFTRKCLFRHKKVHNLHKNVFIILNKKKFDIQILKSHNFANYIKIKIVKIEVF